jgi:hypothetical protein
LCPFAGGKGFELFDNFAGSHSENNIAPD